MDDCRNRALTHLGLIANPFGVVPFENRISDEPGRALDPCNDEQVLPYYMDVYSYRSSGNLDVGGIDLATGLSRFPRRRSRPILILIAGEAQTGLTSMVNLCLYAIRKACVASPLIIHSLAVDYDIPDTIKEIADDAVRALWTQYPTIAEALRSQFAADTAIRATTSAPYRDRFKDISSRLPATFDDPVVIVLENGEQFDLWTALARSTVGFADFILATTPRRKQAETAVEISREGHDVILITSSRLSRAAAREFVNRRFALAKRSRSISNILDDAGIEMLYRPGRGQPLTENPTWPIGWLEEVLRRVFANHLDRLETYIARHGAESLTEFDDSELRISPSLVFDVCQAINDRGLR